ncbi:MAG: hypothetical protein QOJ70_559 [Acidobacteriota bacterium]|jgi:hypothetical protein|nr:hypothetical protein [Acidobacteriota bacterium]
MADTLKRIIFLTSLLACAVLCLGGRRLPTAPASAQSESPFARWQAREYPGVRYVGSKVCAQCHTAEAKEQLDTPMAHALESAANCAILNSHRPLTFTNGPYLYRLTQEGGRAAYTVTDGKRTISEPVLYCFGQGEVGQTYIFRHGGELYESRVSYFRATQGLDFTIGHSRLAPSSLDDALGRPIGSEEARSCFGCHAPEAINGDKLRLESFNPGVTCESCHGPGEKHVAAAERKDLKDPQVFNPGELNALDMSQEFCGSCHLGFNQAMLLPEQGGVNNIRFQAYRIFNSPGHRGSDPRISCVACHDPHRKLEHEASNYDSKCFACHLTTSKEAKTKERAASACPVSTKGCVTCHMPKIEIPGMHARFTDHWIRTVKSGETIPH